MSLSDEIRNDAFPPHEGDIPVKEVKKSIKIIESYKEYDDIIRIPMKRFKEIIGEKLT